MRRTFVLLILICFVFSTSGKALAENIRINLDIKGDARLLDKVDSFFSRELRSLGDVEITEKDPHLNIYMTAMEIEDADGNGLGVVTVSYIVTSRLGPSIYSWLVENGAGKVSRSDWDNEWGNVSSLERYGEFITGENDLRGLFEEIVIQLDTKVMKKFRQQ